MKPKGVFKGLETVRGKCQHGIVPDKCDSCLEAWEREQFAADQEAIQEQIELEARKMGRKQVDGILKRAEEILGRKDDAGKARWTLLPWKPLERIVQVLEFGAKKYAREGQPGEDNWQKVENPQERYTNAALRHLVARMNGEKNDPETGLPHLAHLGCCVLFLLWFDEKEAKS